VQLESNVQLAVTLPRFDGPFELLLSLIRRNEYPLDNLPISTITGQFLEYIREAESIDMDLGGEFMETASWLILLKSRSMLPRESSAEAQKELREAVQKYQFDRDELDKTKDHLASLRSKRQRVPAAGAASGRRVEEIDDEIALTAADVLKNVRSAIATARAAASFKVDEALAATVAEQREWVLNEASLFPVGTVLSTDPWFTVQTNVAARASLFLALLELVRTGDILMHQSHSCAVIRVKAITRDQPDAAQETIAYATA
jgi:segregation and condensation protein A